MSFVSTQQKVKIGKLYSGTFYDLTCKFVAGTSITNFENGVNIANFIAQNDFKNANYIQRKEGAGADGYHLDVSDIIVVYKAIDNSVLYVGQITEPMQKLGVDGAFLLIQTSAYPAIGLIRTKINNTYGTFNKPMTLRQIMKDGIDPNDNTLFPYNEGDYTENCTVSTFDGFNHSGYDWLCASLPAGSGTSVALVASDGAYNPKVGSKFIKFGNNNGYGFNCRFGDLAGAPTLQGFPLMIDDLSRPNYNAGTWSGIPYLDFYIYRYHTGAGGQYTIEMQLRVTGNDYMRFQLTDQDHSGSVGGFPSGENQNLELVKDGGDWIHLRIPCGSKWGESQIYAWKSGDPDADWTPTAASSAIAVSHSKVKSWMCAAGVSDIIGDPISKYCGWDMQHASVSGNPSDTNAGYGNDSWNNVQDINFHVEMGTPSPPATCYFGLDSYTIGNLNAGSTTVYDYVTAGPNPYNINFDYVGNILDTSNNPYILPYVNCIWEQATKTLSDLSNLMGAVAYQDSHTPGIHWTTIPYIESGTAKTYLTIAPLGNHNINGVDGSHKPETIWPTASKYTYANPLVLPANVVNASFTKKEQEANFVIANAVFQDPPLNDWCQETFTDHTSGGNHYWTSTNWVYIPDPTNSDPINQDSNGDATNGDIVVGPHSITIPKCTHGISGYTNILYLTVPDFIDLNLLSDAKLTFWLKTFNLQTVEVRVYTDLYDVPISIPPTAFSGASSLAGQGLGNYFWQQIPDGDVGNGQNAGFWKKYNLPLGSGNWKITNHATWSKPIKLILFRIVGGTLTDGWFLLDGLNINATHERAAYSPSAMTALGGMKETVINELIYSGSKLDATIDQLDNLLIQETLRDTTTPITGPVKLPLDFSLMQGQMVYISSPPFGATPKQFRSLWVKHDIIDSLSTTVYLTDDVVNSYARDPSDSMSQLTKAVDPNYQNRNFARLAVSGIPSRSNIAKIVDVDSL